MNGAEELVINSGVARERANSILGDKLYSISKRLIDIVLAAFALIVLSPILLIVAVLIRVDSKGKSIFKQKRIGKDGNPIYIYKFRSMIPNAEEVLEKLMRTNEAIRKEYLENKKLENDPRVTKIGRFIRKTSIDELPQLINILKGDMSFIGPRPYLYREKEDMGGYYQDIIKMTPGLTGLWQVSGRSDVSFKYRCQLDREYYNIRSTKEDFKIMFKTFGVVVFKKGAK